MTKVIDLYPGKRKIRHATTLTVVDLTRFKKELKTELLSGIGALIKEALAPGPRQWLSPQQASRKLNIPISALTKLRETCSIPYCFIDGEFYYDPVDIEKVLKANKSYKRRRK